jgi:hypothetical protein
MPEASAFPVSARIVLPQSSHEEEEKVHGLAVDAPTRVLLVAPVEPHWQNVKVPELLKLKPKNPKLKNMKLETMELEVLVITKLEAMESGATKPSQKKPLLVCRSKQVRSERSSQNRAA